MNGVTFKIHLGTGKLTGTSLCRSCQNGSVWTDRQGEHVVCGMRRDHNPRGNVYDCSDYYSSTLPSLSDMKETAWTLRTEKGGKAIGFTPPKPRPEYDED